MYEETIKMTQGKTGKNGIREVIEKKKGFVSSIVTTIQNVCNPPKPWKNQINNEDEEQALATEAQGNKTERKNKKKWIKQINQEGRIVREACGYIFRTAGEGGS